MLAMHEGKGTLLAMIVFSRMLFEDKYIIETVDWFVKLVGTRDEREHEMRCEAHSRD
jgi:hypothetical protein